MKCHTKIYINTHTIILNALFSENNDDDVMAIRDGCVFVCIVCKGCYVLMEPMEGEKGGAKN